MEGNMALSPEPKMKFFSNIPTATFKSGSIYTHPAYFEMAEYEIVQLFQS